jgi:integrase
MSAEARRQRRGRGSITKRGKDTWLVRATLGTDTDGKQIRVNKVVRGGKGDAEKYLTTLLSGRDGGVLRTRPTKQTLGQWIEEWLADWCVDVSERTRNDYRGIFERYIWPDKPHRLHPDKAARAAKRAEQQGEEQPPAPRRARADERLALSARNLRARRLTDLTIADVQAFLNVVRDCGLAPRTVRMVHGALRACLNTALEHRKIPFNAAVGAKLPKLAHREMRFLTPEQAQRFLAAAEAEQLDEIREANAGRKLGKDKVPEVAGDFRESVYAMFILMLLSGLRIGEALALKWSDLDGATLRVQRAVTQDAHRGKVLGPTKTGRSRAVPLGPRTLDALSRHRAAQARWMLRRRDRYRDEGLIFANELGGLLEAQNIGGRYFKPLLRKAGLPNIRLYDLRHSHATLLMAAGEHPKVVQERLGHATIQLTLDTYTHVVEGLQQRASERLEALLSNERSSTRVG